MKVLHYFIIGLRWLFGVTFLLTALGILVIWPLAAVFFIIAGFTCIPPIIRHFEDKVFRRHLMPGIKLLLVIASYTLASLIIAYSPKFQDESEPTTQTKKDVIIHDTIIIRDTIKEVVKEPVSMGAAPVYSPPQRSTSRSRYITGPRGGCYYINSNGKKIYVDRSLCN